MFGIRYISMILRPPNTWNCPKQEMHGVLVIFNDFGAAGTPPQHYAKQEMHGILYIFKDSGAATTARITQTRKYMEFFTFSMILKPPAPHHSITQTMTADSGAAGTQLQHFPYQEMHGILSFSMILESPAPHHRITQSRKCM